MTGQSSLHSAAPAWVERVSLLDGAQRARVILLSAPGGWGKSTFATQLLARRGAAVVNVRPDADADADGLIAALRRGLRRAGVADLAMLAQDADPTDVLDALLGALSHRSDPLSFFVDEAQHLVDGAPGWLRSFADDLDPRHSLVVAGRALDRALLRRPGAGWVRYEVADLRFTEDEVSQVIGTVDRDACRLVCQRTDGWPAAVSLAARVDLGRPDETLLDAGTPARAHLLDRLLDDLLGSDRDSLAVVGVLPLLDRTTVDLAAGTGAFDRLLGSGLPMRRVGVWWSLADPVRNALAVGSDVELPAADAIARCYEPHTGVMFLLGLDRLDDAARLLAEVHWSSLDQFGARELAAVIDILGAERLVAHPRVLLNAARTAELRDPELRRRWIEHGLTIATPGTDVFDELRAEQWRDRVRSADGTAFDEAVAALPSLPAGPTAARARTLLTIGIWHAVQGTPERLAKAETAFTEAAGIMHLLGEHRWEADALNRVAYLVSFQGGRLALAAEQQATSLALLPSGTRDWAVGMTYYADILDHLGRSAESEAAALAALDYGNRVGDSFVIGLAAWTLAIVYAHRNDLDATRRWLDEVERSPGNWSAAISGQEFLSFGSDLLGTLGDRDGAYAYRERCAARVADGGSQSIVDVLDGRLEAMFGDPRRAIELFDRLDGEPWATIRARWIRSLFRALSALRLGERAEATRYIERSLELVEQMGVPDLPFRHEPYLVQLLADVWPGGAASAPAAAHVSVLGRFAVTRGTDVVTPSPGNPATLVKVLTLRGSLTVEQAIDLLWPDADAPTGRARLRNLLNRIRGQAGDLVVRNVEVLQLGADVVTDVARFDELVEHTLAAPSDDRPGAARVAMAAYGGELLPGDVYEDWAAGPRERLRRRYLSLVDIVAEDALTRGDIDEGMRLLDTAIEHEPLEVMRYERAAQALVASGRRAAARETVLRARAALDEIGVAPSGELAVIGRSLDVW